MAIRAYNEVYLSCAQRNLGEMLRYAVENVGIPANDFFELFLQSGIADLFGHGDYRYITGMSGVEVVYEVLRVMLQQEVFPEATFNMEKSPVYWAGWILAFYQWVSGLSFERIFECLKVDEIVRMYDPYHEMDPLQFVAEADRRVIERNRVTRLKMYREKLGISQSELARESGCSVRMIQQYEQRRKDINKTQAETVLRIAQILRCRPEELMEYKGSADSYVPAHLI